MTQQDYIKIARLHKEKLVELVRRYHPRSPEAQTIKRVRVRPTAIKAQRMCDLIANEIKSQDIKTHPAQIIEDAIDAGAAKIVDALLNETWFGIPESTISWSIPGFKEAIALMEDPPEPLDIQEA